MFETFTDRACRVLSYAHQEALAVGGHRLVDEEDILLGLYREPTGIAAHALDECGASERQTRGILGRPAPAPGTIFPVVLEAFTKQAQWGLRQACEEAKLLSHERVGTEHVLLGLLKIPEPSFVTRLLKTLGVDPRTIVRSVHGFLGTDKPEHPADLQALTEILTDAVSDVTVYQQIAVANGRRKQPSQLVASILRQSPHYKNSLRSSP